MKRYKYQAQVRLLPQHAGDGEATLPGPTCRAVVRARHHESRRSKLFSALVTTSDDGQLPGSLKRTVTMVVLGDDAGDYLTPGGHFVLWRGGDVGRGTVTRRLFF